MAVAAAEKRTEERDEQRGGGMIRSHGESGHQLPMLSWADCGHGFMASY